jgi:predicted DNA binding CopG/RHH family protein
MRDAPDAGEMGRSDLDEMAAYFDQTDAGDLPWDEATDLAIQRPELEQISLRLPTKDLAALKRRAAAAGVGYTTLIRMILRQHLRSPLSEYHPKAPDASPERLRRPAGSIPSKGEVPLAQFPDEPEERAVESSRD